MTHNELGVIVASLSDEERSVFLLTFADELYSEKAAHWVRGVSLWLNPFHTPSSVWWFQEEHTASGDTNGVPMWLFEKLSPTDKTLISRYSTKQDTWSDLFRVLISHRDPVKPLPGGF